MHIETKIIDGVRYVEESIFNDFLKQDEEIIDELDREIKKLKSEIYRLTHPEEFRRIQTYLN